MRAAKLLLHVLVFSVTYSLTVFAKDFRFSPRQVASHDHMKEDPWKLMQETVQTYANWGSVEGALMPLCFRFDDLFVLNKTWMSPFAGPNGYIMFDIEKGCDELAWNITWHSGNLEAGNYIYPFYYGQDSRLFRVAFFWTAVGKADYREIFGLKSYDFTIISTMELLNETAVIFAKDIFWPESKNEVPEALSMMIQQYMSLMDGDCQKFPELFREDYGSVTPSGSTEDFYGTKGLTAYCEKMMYEWGSYVYHLNHVTYSVSKYTNIVNEVTFTWARTGVYLGQVKTDQVLTDLVLQMDNTPLHALKISEASDFFEPHGEKAKVN